MDSVGDSSVNKLIEFAAMHFPPLPREFYDRDPADVARELLGKRVLRETDQGLCGGRIVEVEAYLSQRDSACHARRGKTKKNASMFGPPGHVYVYMIHARWCLNAVTQGEGIASAILIRALEPIEGIADMQNRRGTDQRLDLCRGPARLCQALGITRDQDGLDLTQGRELWIGPDPEFVLTPRQIVRSRRIGVSSAHSRLLRYFVADSRFVSGRRNLKRLPT